eukprot:403783-Rhodomonas_salina.1
MIAPQRSELPRAGLAAAEPEPIAGPSRDRDFRPRCQSPRRSRNANLSCARGVPKCSDSLSERIMIAESAQPEAETRIDSSHHDQVQREAQAVQAQEVIKRRIMTIRVHLPTEEAVPVPGMR